MVGDTYSMQDVLGYLGISYARQNLLCKSAGITLTKGPLGHNGRVVRYYDNRQFKSFLKAAGYQRLKDLKGEVVLVHESNVKEWKADR